MRSAVAIAGAVSKGEASAVEIARAALARIAAKNPALNALLFVDAEGALAQAAAIDRARAAGVPLGPLAGVPIVLKDNLCQRGTPTTCASKILEGWIAPYDAGVVIRLREAGAVIELHSDVLLERRLHGSNVSRHKADASLNQYFELLRGHIDQLRRTGTSLP